jgi:hypothetical protein
VSSDPGRIVALVPVGTASVLRQRGWEVDELDDQAGVARWCASLVEAEALCERDLPSGTAVSWRKGSVVGGFVSGYPGVAPELGGAAPAFVLWPDGGESFVESVGELAQLMRGRMQWLAQLASQAGFPDVEVAQATSRTLAALDRLEETGVLGYDAGGPIHDVRCGAQIEPVAQLRWKGFRDGWRGVAPDPVAHPLNGHPVHGDRQGAYVGMWRQGVEDGIQARTQS